MQNLVAALGTDDMDQAEALMVHAAEQARADGVAETERREAECPVQKAGRFKAVRTAKKKLHQALNGLVQALKARALAEGSGHDAARRAREDKARRQKKAQAKEKKEKKQKGIRPTQAWQRLQRAEATEEETTAAEAVATASPVVGTSAAAGGGLDVGSVGVSRATLDVRAAHAVVKQARAQLRKAVVRDNAYFMRMSRTKAPRSYWKAQALLEEDAGNAEDDCTKLLQHLNNAKGQMITRDHVKIRAAIHEHVRIGFQVRSELSIG
jgi:hypothetical protein